MAGWIVDQAGLDPTIMNGAEMKNFASPETPYASARVGKGSAFVSEVDESDGSIALYNPAVAVVTNISHDHKSMEELRELFGGFVGRARTAVLNFDNAETARLAEGLDAARVTSFSLENPEADLYARNLAPQPWGITFEVVASHAGEAAEVKLKTPGRHNVANALAAIGAATALGVSLKAATTALGTFTGVRRRLDVVGEAGGVTVIDDFAHNPDKIAATLDTLHAFPGRLLMMFQPHGYGPLKLMGAELVETLAGRMTGDDVLFITEPVYYGGTTDRSVSSADVAAMLAAKGKAVEATADRPTAGERLLDLARAGDRIVIMGARDDSLSVFAAELLERLRNR
jgi:UDP-N-acetylmuramate--alanine ligase